MSKLPLTLMAVHAHPDDEAISTGGILAIYARQGVRTVLVTCTDGQLGDGPAGVKPGEPGHDPASIVGLRRQELEASCRVLGVDHLELLGYQDSGMMGWPQNDAPGAFWREPVHRPAARLAALMEQYRPDVVVTYNERGFYGHPDHIQAHRITMAAADRTGIPAKVYYTAVPRSAFAELGRLLDEREAPSQGAEASPAGSEGAAGESESQELPPEEVATADDLITTAIDCSAVVDVKRRSLQAHASQADNIFFLSMKPELFNRVMSQEWFVRVRDRTGISLPEDDLFAGVR